LSPPIDLSSFFLGFPPNHSLGLSISLSQKGQNMMADTSDIFTDPEGKQPGKRDKQEQEIEYKKEKESDIT